MSEPTRYRRPKQKQSSLQIRDIARMAGVSPQTISRYFKNPDSIRQKNRDRIARVVAETGYYPNPVARSLSSNRSNLVAAIVPTIDHSIFSEVLSGLSATLEQKGFVLLIASNDYSLKKEEGLVRRFLAQKVAGVVLVGQNHTDGTRALLKTSGVPIVEVLEIDTEAIDCSIGFSNFAASYEITSRLIECGLRKVAFLSAPFAGNDRVQRRFEGYRQALADAGLAYDSTLIDTAEFSIRNGERLFSSMISRHPDLRAVVSNDILALGILLQCKHSGIVVPDQVSVTGFDDLEIASVLDLKLTTVRINGFDMGVAAAKQVLDRQSETDGNRKTIDVGYEIVWRESTPARCKRLQ